MMTGHILGQKFSNYFEAAKLLRKGDTILCSKTLKNCVRRFCGDMTFLEIWEKNKWNLNITVTDGGR